MDNDKLNKTEITSLLELGKKNINLTQDKKIYKCLIGIRQPSSDNKINFKNHTNSLNKAINAYNQITNDCKVKLIRTDLDNFAIKVTTEKVIMGKDDLFFLCLNAISSNLNLLGFKKYSEATNGRMLFIIDIEEITINSDDVVNDQSIKVDVDELVRKIKVLSELINMGLDEDGSRALSLKKISDTVNNELL